MKRFVGVVLSAMISLCLLAGCNGAQTSEKAEAAQTVQTAKATEAPRDLSAYKALCKPLDYEAVQENLYAAQDWVYFDATVIEVTEQVSEEDGRTYMMALAFVGDNPDTDDWIYFIAEKPGNMMKANVKANDKLIVYGQIRGAHISEVFKGMGEKIMPKVFAVYYDKAPEEEQAGEPAQAEQPDEPQAEQAE
jgi:hypothetical protein